MTRERVPKGGWLPPGPDFAQGETWAEYLAANPSPSARRKPVPVPSLKDEESRLGRRLTFEEYGDLLARRNARRRKTKHGARATSAATSPSRETMPASSSAASPSLPTRRQNAGNPRARATSPRQGRQGPLPRQQELAL